MARSLKKGPYVDQTLLSKIEGKTPDPKNKVKTWSRRAVITPEMIGHTFDVHYGKGFTEVTVKEEMVGHKLGEFAPTKKFQGHGGKS